MMQSKQYLEQYLDSDTDLYMNRYKHDDPNCGSHSMSTDAILEQSLPKRIEILNILDQLIAGSISRKQVSGWAISLINSDRIRRTDDTVWKVLEGLGSADLPDTDQEFLYRIDDFLAWKEELLAPGSTRAQSNSTTL